MGSGTRKGCAEPGAPSILIVPRRAVRLIVADWRVAAPGRRCPNGSRLTGAPWLRRAQPLPACWHRPPPGAAICYSRPISPGALVAGEGAHRQMAHMDSTPPVALPPDDARFLRDAGWVVVQLPAGLTLAGLRAAGAAFKGTRYFSAHAPHTDERTTVATEVAYQPALLPGAFNR